MIEQPQIPPTPPAEKPPAPVAPERLTAEIVNQLCNGLSVSQIERLIAAGRVGFSLEDFRKHLSEARQKLTLAAQYDRDEELGRAISRLEELYRRAMARVTLKPGDLKPDLRAALLAQKELNRLLGLWGAEGPAAEVPEALPENARKRDENAELIFDAVDAWIEPLGLSGDEKDQYSDLIRLAGAEIRRLRKAVGKKAKESRDAQKKKAKTPAKKTGARSPAAGDGAPGRDSR